MESVQKQMEENEHRTYLLHKEVFSLQEACIYLCISQSYMYKLTSTRKIPHYSPLGKLIYFKKAELDEWIFASKRGTRANLNETAASFVKTKRASK
jgi:excisionase family DNA binding protein